MQHLCPHCDSGRVSGDQTGRDYAYLAPSCRADYRTLIERERSDLRYMRVHALSVDAWAVQHPGPASDETARAVGMHLVSLYAQLMLDASHRELKMIRRRAADTIEFRWLPLPDTPARLGVQHALQADSPEAHRERVQAWALSVWRAWHPHSEQVMSWTRRILGHGRVSRSPPQQHAGWYAGARNAVHPRLGESGSLE
ncbi:MAG: hypothetical protein KGY53_12480 [Wenzhouxiangellaceae bacterium]|jgi:DNA-binding transcriptional ArsR family regulator|nr:hypothetical protein [Wenzhouxiangellaceae bacterium]MBS3824699.1 hypothetical protein [Wenzhouxiangellaceae bacterium]